MVVVPVAIVAGWWGIWFLLSKNPETAGQIGDAFAPISGAFTAVAMAFAGWSIYLQQQEIHESTEEAERQRRLAASVALLQAHALVDTLEARIEAIRLEAASDLALALMNGDRVGPWEWRSLVEMEPWSESPTAILGKHVTCRSAEHHDRLADALLRARTAKLRSREVATMGHELRKMTSAGATK